MIKVGNEREIKFDKDLRYKRQTDYNIRDYETIPFDFVTGHRNVYKNFNFSIFTDDYCNADCKFCVAQLRYQNKSLLYQKEHICDPDKYLTRLEAVLKLIRPLNPSISITGGEPTLCKHLTDIIKLIDKYNFRKRVITTNGSGLFNVQDNSTIIENLEKYHFDHLNISRVHFDETKNQEIMRYNDLQNYCSLESLKDILNYTNTHNISHRISCLLLKEGINSIDMIQKYIECLQNIGANNFIFRELMDYDKTAINTEKMTYCNENKIKLNNIWEDFEKFPEFKPYLNILGYYYYVEIYKYKGATIAGESADLNRQIIEKEKNPDMVYEMIFHNNGNLCGSWIDKEDILDPYIK